MFGNYLCVERIMLTAWLISCGSVFELLFYELIKAFVILLQCDEIYILIIDLKEIFRIFDKRGKYPKDHVIVNCIILTDMDDVLAGGALCLD